MKKVKYQSLYLLIFCLILLSGCPPVAPPPEPEPEQPPVTSLAAPQNIRASVGEYTDKIVITWDAVPSAASYLVFRDAGKGFYALSETLVPACHDTAILQAVHYTYKVQALAAGVESSAFSGITTGYSQLTLPGSTVMVLDSIGGTLIAGAAVEVYLNNFLLYYGTTDSAGEVSVPLVSGTTYDFTAYKAGRAASRLQNAKIAAPGRCLALYCHNLGMLGLPVAAPEVESIAYSNDNITYCNLAPGSTLSVYDFNYAAVTIQSRNIIPDAHFGSRGFVINIDSDTAQPNHMTPVTLECKKTTDNAYQITGVFDLSDCVFMNGQLRLHFTAYDLVNNRVECIVPFSLTGAALTHDPDLSGIEPQWNYFCVETFGNSMEIAPTSRALTAYEDTAVTSQVYLKCMVNDTLGNALSVRKVDLYRSTDDLQYAFIGSINFRGLVSRSWYEYYDNDPTLEPGIKYYYKFTASNAAGQSRHSPAIAFTLLPPYHLNLTSPVHNTVCSTTYPQLAFAISRPELLTSEFIYGFEFSVEVREITGAVAFKKKYSFSTYDMQFETYGDGIDVDYITLSGGTVTIDTRGIGIALKKGRSYEWNIRDANDNWHGVKLAYHYFFNEQYLGSAYTYNTCQFYGGDASNGAYRLTIAPDAQE